MQDDIYLNPYHPSLEQPKIYGHISLFVWDFNVASLLLIGGIPVFG
jgi:hypothetical protein